MENNIVKKFQIYDTTVQHELYSDHEEWHKRSFKLPDAQVTVTLYMAEEGFKKMMRELEKAIMEEELRQKHSVLGTMWEEYQTMLSLLRDE